jgi:hypothetical protein
VLIALSLDGPACVALATVGFYATWRAAADTLAGPPEATRGATVFPADPGYWRRR